MMVVPCLRPGTRWRPNCANPWRAQGPTGRSGETDRRCGVADSSLPHADPLVEVFIPSRDRALQLDGTLRSFQRHCSDATRARVSVLFRGTTRRHRRAYKVVAREHAGVRMLEERSFSRDAARLLGAQQSHRYPIRRRNERNGAEAQLLVVDDTMFVQAFSLESIVSTLSEESDVLGFSLRLGQTICFCQPLGIESPPPELTHVAGSGVGEIVSFRWTDLQGDWGYPLELSSSLYRRGELIELMREITFDSPTTLEHELWLKSGTVRDRHTLLCYRTSKAVSLALNRVQSITPNPTSGHLRHDSTTLLARLLEGWRVDVGAYDGYLPHACHEEAELLARPSWAQ